MPLPVIIGAHAFPSLKTAREHFQRILYAKAPIARVSEEFTEDLRALFRFHPEYEQRSQGRHIERFEVHNRDFGTVCFHAVYGDGSSEHFSFVKCIDNAIAGQRRAA